MAEMIGGNPMKDPKSYLESEQINAIIEATKGRKYKRLFFFLASTGRRVSEVVRCLKRSDIDFEKGLVNFTILKRKKETKYLLPINQKTLTILKEQMREERITDGFIFPMSRQRVDIVFKRAAGKVGIDYIGSGQRNAPHVHLLRHSFAIRGATTAKSPADIVQLKNMMGHSRIDTTMFYLKFNPEDQRELLERMWKKDAV